MNHLGLGRQPFFSTSVTNMFNYSRSVIARLGKTAAALSFSGYLMTASTLLAHDGPDPLARWVFQASSVNDEVLQARIGPNAKFIAPPRLQGESFGQSCLFRRGQVCVVSDDHRSIQDVLPKSELTVAAWVAIDKPERWGGIISAISDDGNKESGWLLGYNEKTFMFGLASQGADDGDGMLTYLRGKTPWEAGKMYFVVATYDGTTMALYVNGQLDATSIEQQGEILYPESTPVVLGGYRDSNEDYRLEGRIQEIAIYDLVAQPAWVIHEFEHRQQLAQQEARFLRTGEGFVIPPYLQYGTQTGMTVMWQTAASASTTVYWGETAECREKITQAGQRTLHEVRIDGLQPETQYFYAVESVDDQGKICESEVLTFSTAVHQQTPYAFTVIGDTQGNPQVSNQIATMAWGNRPNFCIHAGDLVSTGSNNAHWTEHFFPGMKPLIERVPFYPVLGNHEENADNYYRYVALPDPEYYYTFRYGNAEFFMVDSNRNVDPSSDQYRWLEEQLRNSTATWKFACHHHPPYSSDENDYGDLWKTNRSTRGDLRVRQLSELYDKYGVDIVWNRHIHSYERTWPIRNQQPGQEGTIYIVTGGGGGSLETAGPSRPGFQNHVKHGHHYCLVAVNGDTLELKVYDLEGRLFDTTKIFKVRTQPSQTE